MRGIYISVSLSDGVCLYVCLSHGIGHTGITLLCEYACSAAASKGSQLFTVSAY